jgi:uncharacterized protein YlxW (UPF0749 family)
MNRTKGILAAGTLTGLVIITLLGLGFSKLGATADNTTAVPQEVPQQPQIDTADPAAQEAVKAWQDYSAELEQTVRTLQERENAYQSQINAANDTIVNLQDQVNSANSAASNTVSFGGGEHEEHEEHEGFEHDD